MTPQSFSADNTQTGTTTEIDVVGAQQLQQKGAQIIDVREPDEFATGHVKGATNIPLGQLTNRLKDIRTDETVLVICKGGNRGKAAQELLKQKNVADVRNVKGGMIAWQAAQFPIE